MFTGGGSDSLSGPSTASVCFHPHCGSLIKLSNNNRTAERQRPTEEFKNAVTLTNKPLRNDELFEVSNNQGKDEDNLIVLKLFTYLKVLNKCWQTRTHNKYYMEKMKRK